MHNVATKTAIAYRDGVHFQILGLLQLLFYPDTLPHGQYWVEWVLLWLQFLTINALSIILPLHINYDKHSIKWHTTETISLRFCILT